MNTTIEQDRLWQAFHERAEAGYYGYIPVVLEKSDTALAAALCGMIQDLHDLHGCTLRAIADCLQRDSIEKIYLNPYEGTITAYLCEYFEGNAFLEVSKQYIRGFLRVGTTVVINQRLRFDSDDLRHYSETTQTYPRLAALIQAQIARLVNEIKTLSDFLYLRAQENDRHPYNGAWNK